MERLQPVNIQGRQGQGTTIAMVSSERPAATEQSQGTRPETGTGARGQALYCTRRKGISEDVKAGCADPLGKSRTDMAAWWQRSLGENGHTHIHGWVALLSTRNYHNTVRWLYSNIRQDNLNLKFIKNKNFFLKCDCTRGGGGVCSLRKQEQDRNPASGHAAAWLWSLGTGFPHKPSCYLEQKQPLFGNRFALTHAWINSKILISWPTHFPPFREPGRRPRLLPCHPHCIPTSKQE